MQAHSHIHTHTCIHSHTQKYVFTYTHFTHLYTHIDTHIHTFSSTYTHMCSPFISCEFITKLNAAAADARVMSENDGPSFQPGADHPETF